MSKNRNLRQKIQLNKHVDALNDDLTKKLVVRRKQHEDDDSNEMQVKNKCLNMSKAYNNLFANFGMSNDDPLAKSVTSSENDSYVSSSTVSWEEDYEQAYTAKVANELRLMERVLQRKEPIPSNYDEDEYKQWMETFPNESFNFSTMARKNTLQRSNKLTESKATQKVVTEKDDFLTYFDNILQISPIPTATAKKPVNVARNAPTNKTISSQLSANSGNSLVCRNATPEYNSLPVITVDNYVTSSAHNNPSSAKTNMVITGKNIKNAKNVNGKRPYDQTSFLPPLNIDNRQVGQKATASSRDKRSIASTPRPIIIRNGSSAISDILSARRMTHEDFVRRSCSLQYEQANDIKRC